MGDSRDIGREVLDAAKELKHRDRIDDFWRCQHGFSAETCELCIMENREGWSTNYYELPPNARELQDLIEFKQMNFSIGNIFKASYRMGDKDGTSKAYDLRKIIWFAERELRRLENEDQ